MGIDSRILETLRQKLGIWPILRPELLSTARSYRAQDEYSYLKDLLHYAAQHVPYYADLLDRDGDLLKQFAELPILTKQIIREKHDELASDELGSMDWFRNCSGGSTGEPVNFLQDREYADWENIAQQLYYADFLGIPDYNVAPKVFLWGSGNDLFKQTTLKGKLTTALTRTATINCFRMKEADMLRAVSVINRRKPVYIKAYAGSLYQLASFIKERNLRVYSPSVVYTAAEALRPFMREVIEDVFACKAYDFYGSREVGPIAGQCSKGKMHVFAFNNLVEVVDACNSPVKPGEEGRVLVTTLRNRAMPLIRYDIGDTAILGTQCDCGSVLPTLDMVTGRVTDHFVTNDGGLVSGVALTTVFYYKKWIGEIHLAQHAVDHIVISYVPKAEICEAEMEEVNEKLRILMGADCKIEWRQVSEIPRTPQGKTVFTRCLVDR